MRQAVLVPTQTCTGSRCLASPVLSPTNGSRAATRAALETSLRDSRNDPFTALLIARVAHARLCAPREQELWLDDLKSPGEPSGKR